ncbi:MAG: CBS domain-containing protein [Burkholderiaceae bacterium]
MFSVYGSTGRVFRGTLDQMRQIDKAHAPDRMRVLEPVARDGHDSAAREAVEYGSAGATPLQRSAIAAYATTQQAPDHHGWYDMAVAEVMSRKVLSLPADTSIYQAWQHMQRHGRGQAPVVNADGILVGMVTRADLVRFEQLPGPGADPTEWNTWRAQLVESLMLTPVPSVAAQTLLRHAASALLDSALPGLPVVDDDGRLTGFVSRSDVLRAALKDAGLDVWG